MNYYDIEQARIEAQTTINRADQASREAARLITGRLMIAKVDCNTLEKLKRELKNYNMHTRTWMVG